MKTGFVRTLKALGFIGLVLIFAMRGSAQFQASTQDELKMTADPKYPDAAAVVLNYEKKTDNQVGYKSEYARIKILKESAKELATVHLPYPNGKGLAALRQFRADHPRRRIDRADECEAGRPHESEGRRDGGS